MKTGNYDILLKDKSIKVFWSTPDNIDNNTKVLFVMHGCLRNADKYIETWKILSELDNVIVIVPEFKKIEYSKYEYNYINILKNNEVVSYDDWTFNIIDLIFKDFINRFNLSTKKYILCGHSAGGQFSHRTMLFSNSVFLDYVIAINSGSYTVLDESKNYPYGIKNLENYKNIIANNLSKKMYILVGDLDNDPNHKYFPKDLEFEFQGKNRFERANYFYNTSKNYCDKNKMPFNWKLVTMKDVKHQGKDAIKYVLDIIKSK